MERSHKALCIHHWLLGEPRMQTVRGICRRCGARKTYPSGLELPESVPQYQELDPKLPLAELEALPEGEFSLV